MTSSDSEVRVNTIEAGADDFIEKPFDRHELLARVRSLLRIKQYHDTIEAQSGELADWNRTLERRVEQQVDELQRMSRLRRFLSPTLADVIVTQGEGILESHRQIALALLPVLTKRLRNAEREDEASAKH